jgi:hypothetical protein
LTLHVEHWELRRSPNVVPYPIANMRDRCEFHHYYASRTRTVSAHNGVKVTARSARSDDRVDTGVEDRFGAWQTPECISRMDKEERRSEK